MTQPVCTITGAGEGIGKATALHFAKQGFHIACLGRHEENTSQTTQEIEENGGSAITILADISKPDDLRRAAEDVENKWGRLDVLFANAGINGLWAPVEELTPDEFSKTVSINLNGTFFTIQAFLPLLKKNGGSIIITSSVNGNRIFSNTGATAYSCTKAAQVAMTKMLALELAPDRVRVNCICPGAIETSIGDNTEQRNTDEAGTPVEFPEGAIPLTDGNPGDAEACAETVFFLATSSSSHISGSVLYVDGAQSLLTG
jgi:NAD(P)-dependent dehydrogenase (short-subunit alcohol dehydrogenase family)